MRLRQIVLAASDLDSIENELEAVFGWQVAYRDPIVAKWGLRNIVVPIENDFLEVVSPVAEGTSAGRHLARIGGDGGYMAIFQVDDREAATRRLEESGVRSVYRSDQSSYCLTQFHPADCGGLIVEMEQVLHPQGDWRVPDSYWHAAGGNEWRKYVATGRAGGIRKLVLRGPSACALASRYAMLLNLPVTEKGDMLTIALPNQQIAFIDSDKPGAIERIEIESRDADAAIAAARARGLPCSGTEITIAGVGYRLVD